MRNNIQRVYDMAGCMGGYGGARMKVYINQERVKVSGFKDYMSLYDGMETPVIFEQIGDRWEVCSGVTTIVPQLVTVDCCFSSVVGFFYACCFGWVLQGCFVPGHSVMPSHALLWCKSFDEGAVVLSFSWFTLSCLFCCSCCLAGW